MSRAEEYAQGVVVRFQLSCVIQELDRLDAAIAQSRLADAMEFAGRIRRRIVEAKIAARRRELCDRP